MKHLQYEDNRAREQAIHYYAREQSHTEAGAGLVGMLGVAVGTLLGGEAPQALANLANHLNTSQIFDAKLLDRPGMMVLGGILAAYAAYATHLSLSAAATTSLPARNSIDDIAATARRGV